ncbi:hypothetical protein BDZ97DRAFT_1958266 [Flammula alnicola]|nr:hypothetical protein BDZ97DRAFT_1958266 [Flammula alnicola]
MPPPGTPGAPAPTLEPTLDNELLSVALELEGEPPDGGCCCGAPALKPKAAEEPTGESLSGGGAPTADDDGGLIPDNDGNPDSDVPGKVTKNLFGYSGYSGLAVPFGRGEPGEEVIRGALPLILPLGVAIADSPPLSVDDNETTLRLRLKLAVAVDVPPWASTVDVKGFYDRMWHKLKADMICELVGVSMSRSEFDDAECCGCASASPVISRIHGRSRVGEGDEAAQKDGRGSGQGCEGLGGTLQAIRGVSFERVLACQRTFTLCSQLSTSAQDNHLRALVLALVAAQYLHTSTEHAESMLSTAEQLAAGLGAEPKTAKNAELKKGIAKASIAGSGGDGVGNAHLRLWIGERSLELKRRAVDEQGGDTPPNIQRQ